VFAHHHHHHHDNNNGDHDLDDDDEGDHDHDDEDCTRANVHKWTLSNLDHIISTEIRWLLKFSLNPTFSSVIFENSVQHV